MSSKEVTREEMWARQQISSLDIDYEYWNQKRRIIQQMSQLTSGCIFTVDVFKERYDFASESFSTMLGLNPRWIEKIQQQGDLLEEYIHPDDRQQLLDLQIQHSQFIYSLPFENRNDYSQTFQFRMLNSKRDYINIISSQRVIEKDKKGKAWIIMGCMEVSPDQQIGDKVKRTVLNLKTGEIITPFVSSPNKEQLTQREKEILKLIRQGLLSKEIAWQLGVSIYTIHNHRKNILSKLNVDNAIEAINKATISGLLD